MKYMKKIVIQILLKSQQQRKLKSSLRKRDKRSVNGSFIGIVRISIKAFAQRSIFALGKIATLRNASLMISISVQRRKEIARKNYAESTTFAITIKIAETDHAKAFIYVSNR